jgi:D-alanyl-D-alanine carboxypeptidase/D-alanyl-D-alanine-endopeptidase (penicillin-binding protein 4)
MMRGGILAAIGLAAVCAAGAAQTMAGSGEPAILAGQITALVSDPAVARDHWGVYVTALDGTPIYALNEAQIFQPASNAKLFTTAAAIALLGPNRTFTTKVAGALDPATGHVTGNLTLIGGGDASFDSGDLPYIAPANRPKNVVHQPNPLHDIDDLAAQLAAKGVKAIDGDILGDDTLFPWQPYAADWTIDDAVWGYGAPVSALTIADNQIRLTMTAGTAPGAPGSILLEQAVPYYTVEGSIQTVATKAEATGMQVVRMPGSRILRIFGSMAVKDETDIEEVAIEDPAEYAAMALKAALIEHGIMVTGSARAKHRPLTDASGFLSALRRQDGQEETYVKGGITGGSCLMTPPDRGVSTLATHESNPLAQDVQFTNKVSQNLHAELLLHNLGKISFCSKGSTVEGARVVRQFLINTGIDPNDFVFFDGSGLSGHDLVAPRATAKLLQYASTQPWFTAWRASLPIGGEDGSLASRFPNPPLKDHVFAKTGTLGEARALSGYLDCASGRTVIFSIMVGNHLPGTSADLSAMDKIVAAIAAAE